jgi:hypothetical protein
MDAEQLRAIARSQMERNFLKPYMSKCKVMFSILNNVTLLRHVALEIGADNEPLRHTGEASHLFKLRLPMTKYTAELLLAAISEQRDVDCEVLLQGIVEALYRNGNEDCFS